MYRQEVIDNDVLPRAVDAQLHHIAPSHVGLLGLDKLRDAPWLGSQGRQARHEIAIANAALYDIICVDFIWEDHKSVL